jgi:hypothetical protein
LAVVSPPGVAFLFFSARLLSPMVTLHPSVSGSALTLVDSKLQQSETFNSGSPKAFSTMPGTQQAFVLIKYLLSDYQVPSTDLGACDTQTDQTIT